MSFEQTTASSSPTTSHGEQTRAATVDRAVVFVCDPMFLLPTLVAARQVQQQAGAEHLADVFILLTGFNDDQAATAATILNSEGLQFRRMADVTLPESVTFHQTHVPQTCLARFFITDLIPTQYEHIVYMDGDIQVVGDIAPLLKMTVKEGFVAAANDKYWLGNFGRWRSQHRYLTGLRISDAAKYFNSGILAFRRQTWVEMAPVAFRYFTEHSALCRFHDQSALNAVFHNRREVLHPTYNFISDYTLIGQKADEAKIIHFTGGLKPWFYFGPPWRDHFQRDYQALVKAYPALEALTTRKSAEEQRDMQRAHAKRVALLTILCPPLAAWRRNKFRRYLKRTAFALN